MTAEIPEALELRVGAEQQIVLPGLGSAGYLWSSDVEGESGVVEVNWQHGAKVDQPPKVAGVSAAETAVVIGHAPGEVTLTLTLARSWEQANPRRQHIIRVIVT